MHLVNHANPLHDNLCRCPACKPAPRRDSLARLKVALLIVSVGTLALVAFR